MVKVLYAGTFGIAELEVESFAREQCEEALKLHANKQGDCFIPSMMDIYDDQQTENYHTIVITERFEGLRTHTFVCYTQY